MEPGPWDLHTEDVSIEILDALAAVNMHVLVAMPHILNNSVDVNASTWAANEAELLGNMSMVMHHPAFAGYYVCDDCASATPSVQRNRSIIVEIMRRHDPYHLIYGAGGGPQGEMETEAETVDGVEPAALKTPAHGLVLDVSMVENYRNDLGFHESLGGNDAAFAHQANLRFEPVVNMPGPMRQFGHEGLETMVWIGIIVANAPNLNWFVAQVDQLGRRQIEVAADTTNLKVQELLPSFYASTLQDQLQPVVNVTTRRGCRTLATEETPSASGSRIRTDARPGRATTPTRTRRSSRACSARTPAPARRRARTSSWRTPRGSTRRSR